MLSFNELTYRHDYVEWDVSLYFKNCVDRVRNGQFKFYRVRTYILKWACSIDGKRREHPI